MTKRRQKISPTADIVAKKIFSDTEITTDFIETFLGFRPKSVAVLNGTIEDLKKERDGYFSTTVDVLARLEDGTQVIIEIQVAHQASFLKRLWTYSCQHLVKDLPNVRDKVHRTHDMYEKIHPVYAIALVSSRYFDDERPIRSYIIADRETGQALEQPFGAEQTLQKPFEMLIIELRKFRKGNLDQKKRLWLEFFANREFSTEKTPIVERAETLLSMEGWTKEEVDMIDTWHRNAANHFGELETYYGRGVAKGLERGLEQGLAKGLERGLEQGLAKGLEQGLSKGLERGKFEVALHMLSEGFSEAMIVRLTGLSLEDISRLRSESATGL